MPNPAPPPGPLIGRIEELERVSRFQAELRGIVTSVARSLSSTLNLSTSLARLCNSAAPLFAARRASAWVHERRARELVLDASSDTAFSGPDRIVLAASESPLATALRRETPEMVTLNGARALAIPLRGRRRALGLLVLEGLSDAGIPLDQLLDGASELGRQVSTAIENTILFEDILRSRRELENTFNSLADLVIVCDRRMRVANVNRAFLERAGRGNNPIDRHVSELVGPALGSWIQQLDLDGGRVDRSWSIDLEDSLIGGHFSVRVTPLHGADRVPLGAVIVCRDIGETLKLQAERAALGERLAQSEKLAALGHFVAGVAHELNNPLQAVLGHIELLRTTGPVPRALQSQLRTVYREAERAARIVNDLLVFAGSRRGARRRVNLNAVATRTLALRSAGCRRAGIVIERELDRALPPAAGDATLLQQALLNIIVNAEHAIAATGARKGRIRVRTRADHRRHRVVLEVEDSGTGIPAEVLPRIFEPFFTTKEVGQGTGLGLALVYGIVQEHQGEVVARNRRGGGAVFRIELPAAPLKATE
jgi:signal transduction histidine kinase